MYVCVFVCILFYLIWKKKVSLRCKPDQIQVVMQPAWYYNQGCLKYSCFGNRYRGRFLLMLDISNYYSSTSGHLCDLDHCVLKTSLKLHTFGRRFYGCRCWSPVSTISSYSKIYVCAISHQFVVSLFMCSILMYRMMTMHVSSSNGWTPTLVHVAQ